MAAFSLQMLRQRRPWLSIGKFRREIAFAPGYQRETLALIANRNGFVVSELEFRR